MGTSSLGRVEVGQVGENPISTTAASGRNSPPTGRKLGFYRGRNLSRWFSWDRRLLLAEEPLKVLGRFRAAGVSSFLPVIELRFVNSRILGVIDAVVGRIACGRLIVSQQSLTAFDFFFSICR